MATSLEVRLDKIRSNPRLESQQQTQVVLSAVEDTLRDQKADFTPTAYFSALLSLLGQYVEEKKGVVNKDVATAVVYLLDLVTPHVPGALLRSKFAQILQHLAAAITTRHSEAPLLRASVGCLESLLLAQDAQGWAMSQAQVSPRKAVGNLLGLSVDHRPKVRKRALDALSKILRSPPPSPSLDHPAADMCAESALVTLKVVLNASKNAKKQKESHSHTPSLIHALQLVKTIAAASGGWPSRKIDSLCELLLGVSKSSNEHLTMAAFEVFEAMFEGLADEVSSAKLPHVLEIISNLQPSQNDSQLLPPWLAVVSRGYDVASQVNAEETFQGLPEVFAKIAGFLSAQSHNIRVSAAECLVSFMVNCIPASIIIEPSIYDEKTLEKLAKIVTDLLSVKYQSAWMEVFTVIGAMFDNLRWRSEGILDDALRLIGELRKNESFSGKVEADTLLAQAIRAMGPDNVLRILPLNIGGSNDEPGRAWMLPILRDAVGNTRLAHFRSDLVPLSEKLYQLVLAHGTAEKTMNIKIFETIVNQIWATLPGYCDLPLDLNEALDQSFAEQLANLLYQQIDLRTNICRALQNLVDSNRELIAASGPEADLLKSRISEEMAQNNLKYLSSFAGNFLAVLFNIYTQTLPQYRGPILQCINAYLSILPEEELSETFSRVVSMLEGAIKAEQGPDKKERPAKKSGKDNAAAMPPTSHTLMDLVITLAVYLPRSSLSQLFAIATVMLQTDDLNLQKKAYKLIPRLAESEAGKAALTERSQEIQQLLLSTRDSAHASARKDRLAAMAVILQSLPKSQLHFIPAIIPEVTMATKEQNEKARTSAYDMLVAMGNKLKEGGVVDNSKVPGLPADAPKVQASIDAYFEMLSAGLLGSSPQAISASVASQARVLHEFHSEAQEATIVNLVETMDIFLQNPNTEIIRSVLGFVKCCILDLPESFMVTRLSNIISSMLAYEHVHKGAVQAKVKHIMERLIRKYGFTRIDASTPEEGKKFINNIRKAKERKKRQKAAATEEDVDGEGATNDANGGQQKKFGNEFDEAVYGSDDDLSSEESEASDDEMIGRSRQKDGKLGRKQGANGSTYIVEDDDEPLDLLDKRSLGKISSTRPVKKTQAPTQKRKARMDMDGKLVFNDRDEEADEPMGNAQGGDDTLAGGINAYVAAIKGADAARRGQKGKIKFSNKRRADTADDEGDLEEDEIANKLREMKVKDKRGGPQQGGGRNGKPVNGIKRAKMQRKGLGAEREREKIKGGRVHKGGRGRPSGRR